MNRETSERLQYLLLQWLEGRETPGEAEELSQALADASVPDEDWDNLQEELMAAEPLMAGYDVAAWQPVIEGLIRRNRAAAGPVRVRRMRRWMAAAAVLVLLAGGVWLLRPGTKPPTVVAPAVVHDLLPGGNKATLTLANGQRIVLDSAANGLLAQQGASRVQKTANGRLTYSFTASDRTVVVYNTLTTPRGGEYQLRLPDGTQVWLNAASSITYPTVFTGGERKITITGEAYFEVASVASQPFIVEVGGEEIRVLGTAFNVNAYTDEAANTTTLLQGKVEVKEGEQRVVLLPGQQAQVSGINGVRLLKHADTAAAVAWKNGRFAFEDAELPAVMRQLARWYDFDVRYDGPVPAGHFDGKIGKTLTLDQVLRVLTRTRVHYSIGPGRRLTIQP